MRRRNQDRIQGGQCHAQMEYQTLTQTPCIRLRWVRYPFIARSMQTGDPQIDNDQSHLTRITASTGFTTSAEQSTQLLKLQRQLHLPQVFISDVACFLSGAVKVVLPFLTPSASSFSDSEESEPGNDSPRSPMSFMNVASLTGCKPLSWSPRLYLWKSDLTCYVCSWTVGKVAWQRAQDMDVGASSWKTAGCDELCFGGCSVALGLYRWSGRRVNERSSSCDRSKDWRESAIVRRQYECCE